MDARFWFLVPILLMLLQTAACALQSSGSYVSGTAYTTYHVQNQWRTARGQSVTLSYVDDDGSMQYLDSTFTRSDGSFDFILPDAQSPHANLLVTLEAEDYTLSAPLVSNAITVDPVSHYLWQALVELSRSGEHPLSELSERQIGHVMAELRSVSLNLSAEATGDGATVQQTLHAQLNHTLQVELALLNRSTCTGQLSFAFQSPGFSFQYSQGQGSWMVSSGLEQSDPGLYAALLHSCSDANAVASRNSQTDASSPPLPLSVGTYAVLTHADYLLSAASAPQHTLKLFSIDDLNVAPNQLIRLQIGDRTAGFGVRNSSRIAELSFSYRLYALSPSLVATDDWIFLPQITQEYQRVRAQSHRLYVGFVTADGQAILLRDQDSDDMMLALSDDLDDEQ